MLYTPLVSGGHLCTVCVCVRVWHRSSVCRGDCLNVCLALGIPALCWTAVRLYIIYSHLKEKEVNSNLLLLRPHPSLKDPPQLQESPGPHQPLCTNTPRICQMVCQKSSDILSKSLHQLVNTSLFQRGSRSLQQRPVCRAQQA